MGQLQEIIHTAVHCTDSDILRPFRQFHDDPFLLRGAGRLYNLSTSCLQFWRGQVQHIRRLDVCNHGKHIHQFRQVMKLGEAVFHLIAVALRFNFQ